MRLKKWVRMLILLFSIGVFYLLLDTNINLPIGAKILYGFLVVLGINLLVNIKY